MELKDWLNSINFTKENLIEDPDAISSYPPYIINRCLSGHLDTVLFANEMNKYADLPEETPYLIIRSMNAPWNTLFLVIILWVFVSVFIGLLPRTLCRIPNYIRLMGIWVMLGQLLSVYIMVVPSLQHDGHYHIFMGMHELLITLGFVGAFFLCYLAFLGKLPILPISDKHLCRTWHGH